MNKKTAQSLITSLVSLSLLICIFGFTTPVFSQEGFLKQLTGNTSSGSEELDNLIGKAREHGSTIVIINPPETETEIADQQMPMTSAALLQARENLRRMIIRSRNFFGEVDARLKDASADGSPLWILTAVITAVGGMLIGLGIYKLITSFLREYFKQARERTNPDRAQKLGFLLARATLLFISTLIMFGIAILVAVIFDTRHEPTRMTIYTIVLSYAVYRVLRYVIFLNVFAPDTPNNRLINLDDERARRIYRDWYLVIGISVVLLGFCQWLIGLGVDRDIHNFAFILASGLSAIFVGNLAIRHRDDLVEIIRGKNDRNERAGLLELIGRITLPLILIYLMIAWFVSTYRLSLELPRGYILVGAPLIVFVVAIFFYGLSAYVVELIYKRRAYRYRREQVLNNLRESREARRRAAAAAPPIDAAEDRDSMVDDGEEMLVYSVERKVKPVREYQPAFKSFFERSIGALILVVSAGETARIWGFDLGREGGHPFARFLDMILIILIAVFLVRSVNEYINQKMIEEGGSLTEAPIVPGEGDSEGGVGKSRLATLLPIVRNVVTALVVVIGITMGLATMGVNVAPLFAGAGVVGLAIGFGAQTLIRDIFSGVFFLIDDAFRKGEYIEVGTVRGVIEKISVRSFQLRHHLGAVHTVPFGEIHQLTNFSRDWVMMKLPLRVTYGTDVEKVRKLIKKLGQKLLEHPVIGRMFIQPLKSQGVYSMEDSAMIIRVKFMTKPGDQFVVRKIVYAEIRELFEREGIAFAHREVTVRLADGKNVENLTDEEREAVAGSVRSAVEQEERRPVSATGDR